MLTSQGIQPFSPKEASSASGVLWFTANCQSLSSKIVFLKRFRSSSGEGRQPKHKQQLARPGHPINGAAE
jgi:hypothetical protein